MMKKNFYLPVLFLFSIFSCSSVCLTRVAAQESDMKKWESTAYCSYTRVHPLSIIRTDNNWELLRAMHDGIVLQKLDSLGIQYSSSQLYLLYLQDLIARKGNVWKTVVPMLDSVASARLRGAGKQLASEICRDILPQARALERYLEKNDMAGNSYSILFSYVLDGLIWDKLEEEKVVLSRESENGNWAGLVWFLYPKLERMKVGTNTYGLDSNARFVLTWGENAPMVMSSPDSLLQMMRTGNSHCSPELKEKFIKYGYLSPAGKIRVPYIRETKENALYVLSDALAAAICRSFLQHAALEQIVGTYGLPDVNAAAIILYHAVLPELADALAAHHIMKLPRLFIEPDQAPAAENASVCFIIDK